MYPNFFIIGAAKAGTTALHEYLAAHDEIHMSAVKETNFFAPVDLSEFGSRFTTIMTDREEYESLFDSDLPVRGESSPSYSMSGRRPGVPGRIKEAVPEAKFIYMVRDPVDRIWAQHAQNCTVAPCGPLEEVLGDIGDPANAYVSASRYMTVIDDYLGHFEPERIMVMEQDDLRTEREATLRRVFEFLEVDPDFWDPSYEQDVNVTRGKRAYSDRYARIAALPPARVLRDRLPVGAKSRLKDAFGWALRPPLEVPPLSDATRLALERELAPEAERLREFTGRDFAGWSV